MWPVPPCEEAFIGQRRGVGSRRARPSGKMPLRGCPHFTGRLLAGSCSAAPSRALKVHTTGWFLTRREEEVMLWCCAGGGGGVQQHPRHRREGQVAEWLSTS